MRYRTWSVLLYRSEILLRTLYGESIQMLRKSLLCRKYKGSGSSRTGATYRSHAPEDYDKPDAEADLLAIVDGESIFCEVKSAWRSLRTVHLEDFVLIAQRRRPDLAIPAVMQDDKRFEEEIR